MTGEVVRNESGGELQEPGGRGGCTGRSVGADGGSQVQPVAETVRAVSAVPRGEVPLHSAGRLGVASCWGASGQEAPSPLRTDGGTSRFPAGVPWKLARLAVPTLPSSPVKCRKGQPVAVLAERASLSCRGPPRSPPEPPLTASFPWNPELRGVRTPAPPPGSPSEDGDVPRGTGRPGRGEAVGKVEAAAPSRRPRPRRAPAPGLRRANTPGARRDTPRGTWSRLRVLAVAAGEVGTWEDRGGAAPGHPAGPLLGGPARDGRRRRARGGGSGALSRREAPPLWARPLPSGQRTPDAGWLPHTPSAPCSTSGPQRPARVGPGRGTRHPRRGGPAGGASAGSDLREGTWGSRSPAHRARGPAHTSPWPRPPLPGHSPSCRLTPAVTRLPWPGAEPTALLGRPAPPASPPLPCGRPENPERGSRAPPGPGGRTGHAQ